MQKGRQKKRVGHSIRAQVVNFSRASKILWGGRQQVREIGQAIERTLGLLQVGGGHVGVALGRAQAPVAEQRLDRPDIRPVLQQVGGAGVAQRIGIDVFGDLGAPAGLVGYAIDALAREGQAGWGRGSTAGCVSCGVSIPY
jgi:hypothetical protein